MPRCRRQRQEVLDISAACLPLVLHMLLAGAADMSENPSAQTTTSQVHKRLAVLRKSLQKSSVNVCVNVQDFSVLFRRQRLIRAKVEPCRFGETLGLWAQAYPSSSPAFLVCPIAAQHCCWCKSKAQGRTWHVGSSAAHNTVIGAEKLAVEHGKAAALSRHPALCSAVKHIRRCPHCPYR